MACSIAIPFWPTSTDCLDWSADNQIAIAGGERLAILVPCLPDAVPGQLWWQPTYVQANTFTAAELPRLQQPLSAQNFSLGEETSTFQVHAAKWSSPGLAEHGGCAMAVLTSNHVLSIWVREKQGFRSTSWSRAIIVNHAVRRFYRDEEGAQHLPHTDEQGQIERQQVQQRVRAFAWMKPLHTVPQRGYRHLFAGTHFLVVATEGGFILVLRVESVHNNPCGGRNPWDTTVVGHMDARDADRQTVADEDRFKHVAAADYIATGDWRTGEQVEEMALSPMRGQATPPEVAPIFAVIDGKLYSTIVVSDPTRLEVQAVPALKRHLPGRSDITGPLAYVSGPGHGSILAFGRDTIFCGELKSSSRANACDIVFQEHHADDRWDTISGIALTAGKGGSPRVHIASHFSSCDSATASMKLFDRTGIMQDDSQSSWQHMLNNLKAACSSELDLGGHVQARTWGIASSPIGDHVATCATLHPSDAITYLIERDQNSHLSVTFEGDDEHLFGAFPPETSPNVIRPPAGTILFFLRLYLQRTAENGAPAKNPVRSALIDQLSRFMISPQASVPREGGSSDAVTLLRQLKMQIYASDAVQRAQAARIIELALKGPERIAESICAVFPQVTRAFFALPSVPNLLVDDYTMCIRRIFDIGLSRLYVEHRLGELEPSAKDWCETCVICNQSIAFESFRWAQCAKGHQYQRCSLSLLAIQEPGMLKHCSVCNLQYSNMTALTAANPDMGMIDAPDGGADGASAPVQDTAVRSSTTCAGLLYAACSVCIYCGGQFTY